MPVMSPYMGRHYTPEDIAEAIDEYSDWLIVHNSSVPPPSSGSSRSDGGDEVEHDGVSDEELVALVARELQHEDSVGDRRLAASSTGAGSGAPAAETTTTTTTTNHGFAGAVVASARALARGESVAWFQGRAEFGPRALGARSLLADPRNASLAAVLNRNIKKREAFRPFAPAVLAEHAAEWFEDVDEESSPYMQQTALVASAEKREAIPGVLHGADGSARLQTVQRGLALSEYRALILAFFALTGVPLVLNTSFNLFKGEPIVESPADAIRAFIAGGRGTDARIGRLVMHDMVLTHRACPLDGVVTEDVGGGGEAMHRAADGNEEDWWSLVPRQRVYFRSESVGTAEGIVATVRVFAPGVEADEARWVALTDSLELAILEATADGEATVRDLVTMFVEEGADDDEDEAVTARDVIDRLRSLWKLTLLAF